MSSNDSLPMQVKASRDGITLVPHPTEPFDSILGYMQKRLDDSRDFFHHSRMILDLRSRSLRTDEINALHGLLAERSEAGLVEIKLGDGLSLFLEEPRRNPGGRSGGSRSGERRAAPLIVRRACRSGTRVVSDSDCVVLGDVNPGAEIIASGDIVVFGSLRGLAHAGAAGDREARIWALSIEPNQLRIADLVAVPPRGGKRAAPKRYEVAEVRENLIEVITA